MKGPTAYDKLLSAFLMISFFLPSQWQVFVLIPICAFFAIRDILTVKEERLWKNTLVLLSLYLLYVLWLAFTPQRYLPVLLKQLEYRASLAVLPLAFFCIGRQTKQSIRAQMKWFLWSCIIVCAVGNIVCIWRLLASPTILTHVWYRRLFNEVTGLHPTYAGMYCCFSLVILWLTKPLSQRYSWLTIFLAFLLAIFLFALLPKMPVVALVFIMSHMFWINRERIKWSVLHVVLPFLLAAMVAVWAIPFTTQRLDEVSNQARSADNVISNSVSMRMLILKIDWIALKKNWLLGVGPGRVWDELTRHYLFMSAIIKFPLETYDTHNQYFDVWLSFGLIGIVSFVLMLWLAFMKAIRSKDRLFFYFMIILCVTFFTENVLSTQTGVVFFAFFISLFFLDRSKQAHHL